MQREWLCVGMGLTLCVSGFSDQNHEANRRGHANQIQRDLPWRACSECNRMLIFWILVAVLVICALWRWACQYWCIPWPSFSAFWLENPYMLIFSPPRRVIRYSDVRPGHKVLELGCGAGRILIPAAEVIYPNEAVGIDLQKSMIRQLHKKKGRQGQT